MDDESTPTVRISLQGVSLSRKARQARWLQTNNIPYKYISYDRNEQISYFEMNAGDAILFKLMCDL